MIWLIKPTFEANSNLFRLVYNTPNVPYTLKLQKSHQAWFHYEESPPYVYRRRGPYNMGPGNGWTRYAVYTNYETADLLVA